MTPEGRILDKMELDNGLTLYFYDRSRPVAGDRWQVQLLVHVPLEIKEDYFQCCIDSRSAYKKFSAAFSGEIAFQQEKIRNFVHNNNVESYLVAMKQEVLEGNLTYLSKPGFAEKYIAKKYREWEQERVCRMAHMEAVSRVDGYE